MTIWIDLTIGIGSGLAWVWWRRRVYRRAETKVRLTLVKRLNEPERQKTEA